MKSRASFQSQTTFAKFAPGLVLFALVIVFIVIFTQIGRRFHLALDEGIYLQGALRVARDRAPFRDFFALTGPGDFWLYGILFRLFGPSFAISRAALSCELALICAAIYWLASRFSSRLFAAAVAALYLAMLLTSPYQLYINHRWDSNTLAVLAVVALWAGTVRQKRTYFLVAGVLVGAAAWTTPPVAIAVAAMLFWTLFQPGLRMHALNYCAGVAGISAAALSVLLYQGALAPMVQQLLWSAGNYRSPNSVPYGYLSGDVTQLLAGGRTAVRTAEAMLPAILPPVAYAEWGLVIWWALSRGAGKKGLFGRSRRISRTHVRGSVSGRTVKTTSESEVSQVPTVGKKWGDYFIVANQYTSGTDQTKPLPHGRGSERIPSRARKQAIGRLTNPLPLAGLLLIVSAAMLAACYPRFGGHQLLFVSPLFWVLSASALFLAIPAAWRNISAIALLVAAAALWIGAAPPKLPYRIQTQAGEVECSKRHYTLLSGLMRRIQPGDGLFVFPYLPMVYFVTGGKNPTRYSFMQPGMMNADDEASVIADLRAHPPRWIVWHDFSDSRIMSNWPNTDPARLHFLGIERFFAENYRVVNAAEAASVGYRLLESNRVGR